MKIRNIKEIMSDERTSKVVKTLVILNSIRVAGKLVYYTARYGPKTVERVKHKIAERKKLNEEHKEEYKRFTTLRKMYRDIGSDGISKYVEENKYLFEISNNFEDRI